jgi:hypothetical protein
MYEEKFTEWFSWINRENATDISYPGVYVCAVSQEDISGNQFSWLSEIIYIGMTNSIAGLKGRLKQFDNTIIGKRGHGGADRVRYKYQNYQALINQLYVAVAPFKCDVKSNKAFDLRVMGEVAKFEYDCFAHFVELFDALPEFNNKKQSPKYSLTIGRNNIS